MLIVNDMNIEYSVDNFRVFKDNAPSMHLAPITILTGCNSSGKSSIVKSMLLLRNFMKDLSDSEFNLRNTPVDFSSEELLLGRYDKVLNKDCKQKEREQQKIVYHYSIHSALCRRDFKVEYVVVADENDDLNNGWLKEVRLLDMSGNLILELEVGLDEVKVISMNFKTIKYDFIKRVFCEMYGMYEPYEPSYYEIEKYYPKFFPGVDTNLFRDNLLEDNRFMFAGKLWPYEDEFFNLLEYDTLFHMKCFEYLKGKTKEETIDELQTYYKGSDEDVVVRYFEKLVEDFRTSKSQTLHEFYLDLEDTKGVNKCLNWSRVFPEYQLSRFRTMEEWGEQMEEDLRVGTMSYSGVAYALLYYSSNLDETYGNKVFEGIKVADGGKLYNYIYEGEIYRRYDEYVDAFLSEVFVSSSFINLRSIGSSRVDVKRLYSLDGSDRFGKVLQRYMYLKRSFKADDYEPDTFLNHWLKKFEVGDRLSLRKTEDGYGVIMMLHSESDQGGHQLCDEGYGITQLVSMLINLETVVLNTKSDNACSVDCKSITVALEEPEVHLHPRYQSLLADMFKELYKKYGVHVIIESHSEYMIRKFQTLIASGKEDQKDSLQTEDLSIYYMYDADEEKRPKDKKDTQLERIVVGKDGRLQNPFGSGFFDEADNLSMDLLM